ncbi:coiled-coil domain-containing protein 68 [Chlamydotis macqueenii]
MENAVEVTSETGTYGSALSFSDPGYLRSSLGSTLQLYGCWRVKHAQKACRITEWFGLEGIFKTIFQPSTRPGRPGPAVQEDPKHQLQGGEEEMDVDCRPVLVSPRDDAPAPGPTLGAVNRQPRPSPTDAGGKVAPDQDNVTWDSDISGSSDRSPGQSSLFAAEHMAAAAPPDPSVTFRIRPCHKSSSGVSAGWLQVKLLGKQGARRGGSSDALSRGHVEEPAARRGREKQKAKFDEALEPPTPGRHVGAGPEEPVEVTGGLEPLSEQRNARIVMTTLLLTEQVTREERGSEGNYVLYGSSCAEITEEAEYVKKQPPQASGDKAEPKSSGWRWSRGPVAMAMKETEERLLLVSRENQVLKIKLEATREAGVQALRSASQKLYGNYQTRSEELKKSHEKEKQQIQASNLQEEEKLRQISQNASRLAEGIGEKRSRVAELEKRVQRMEEEKKTLIEKKTAFEKTLQEMTSRNEDSRRCLDLQKRISTLQEQICHLQRVIRAQHHGLRGVIQEAEELKKELRSQDEKIENLTEKLSALEAQNKELKDRVEFWSGQPKTKVSKAAWTDAPRGFGVSPYLMLTRLRKQDS